MHSTLETEDKRLEGPGSNITEPDITDESELDTTTAPILYDITSYGADYDVDGLVKRVRRGDIFIPEFQRDYVWTQSDASRLIESLLLGLPVPGIFLAKEIETNKLLVLDGQQRIKTVQFFYDGYFNPKPNQASQKIFKLINVQPQFEGKTYETLNERDRIKIDDSIIHATIVKQESPDNRNTSIYHIFERLNNGGKKLAPQEMRVAIYHGKYVDMIRELNEYKDWRDIFGRKNTRLKDQELILRFFALFFNAGNYQKPMIEFLNIFLQKHQDCDPNFINKCNDIFMETISFVKEAVGVRAFRPEKALNAAVFDSVMYGLAHRLTVSKPDKEDFQIAYDSLLANDEYSLVVSRSTSDEEPLSRRLQMAKDAFSEA